MWPNWAGSVAAGNGLGLPGGAGAAGFRRRLAATAIARTSRWLLDHQAPDGHWVGELEGDSILQSEYILLLAWLAAGDSAPGWSGVPVSIGAGRLPVAA